MNVETRVAHCITSLKRVRIYDLECELVSWLPLLLLDLAPLCAIAPTCVKTQGLPQGTDKLHDIRVSAVF